VADSEPDALLERSAQLSALSGRLAAVTESRNGQVVLLRGEAGIGKTTLLRMFCAGHGDGGRVLWAGCEPLFTPRPLGPLLDVAALTGGELREKVEAGAAPHDVATALLREVAGPAPTVLIVEDLHWADAATLDVIRLVARRVATAALLLVATYRDEELGRIHPLRLVLGELPAAPSISRLELAPLSRDAVAQLCEASHVDPAGLYARTAGNPFFVTEAIAAGSERMPATVRDAVLARAARLNDAARGLLDAVAIVPRRAEVWLLESISESPVVALDECLHSGMLRAEADGVAFRHELARLAIEESIAADRVVGLHRRAIAALSAPGIGELDLARLAHHAEAAGDAEPVLRFATAAAEHAASVGAHREAESQYARALRFAHGLAAVDRAELLQRFADECYVTEMREQGLEALDEALAIHERLGDRRRQGHIQQLRARMLVCIARVQEARIAGRRAVSLLGGLEPGFELARAKAVLCEISMRADEIEETIAGGRGAIALAERVGDDEALALSLGSVGTAELSRGIEAGRDKLERGLEVAKEAGLAAESGRIYVNLVAALTRRRDWNVADRYIAEGIEWCDERGLEAWRHYLICGLAESHLHRGRWAAAADVAVGILEGPQREVVGPRQMALSTLAFVRARRGDPGYWPLLEEAAEIARRVGELQYLAPTAIQRAEVAWLEGRPGDIVDETEAAYRLAIAHGAEDFVGELAKWRWRGGLREAPPAEADAIHRLQLGGRWREAAEIWRAQDFRYEAALALADSGEVAPMREALDELHAMGAKPAAAIVARRLRELGERSLPRGPRVRTMSNPAGLTARELEVVPLLAEGLRNAQIAERLIISPKTVDHHVSAILRKLDAGTRGEAGAHAARLGLTKARGPAQT
jgi:DNA-binding CsgD family transcriptional regulator